VDEVTGEQTPELGTLADRLSRLIDVLRPAGQPPQSDEELARAITARGTRISGNYIYLLRTGRKTNPSRQVLDALAGHFKVSLAYFFDDATARAIDSELNLLRAMRDARLRSLATRAEGLSPATLDSLAVIIEQARRIEGLDSGEPDPTGPDSP
jgi:transcriptional regulator with XRE-family HTH domain